MKKKRGSRPKSVSKPQSIGQLLQAQKRPDTASLKGREAGTSTRDAKGKQVGSKARRKKPVPETGIMTGLAKKRVTKKPPAKSRSKTVAKANPSKPKAVKLGTVALRRAFGK